MAQDTGAPDTKAKQAGIFGNQPLGDRIMETTAMVDAFAETVQKNLSCTDKCHAESWRLLTYHGEYCKHLAKIYFAMSRNDQDAILAAVDAAMDYLTDVEREIHPYFDLCLFYSRIKNMLK